MLKNLSGALLGLFLSLQMGCSVYPLQVVVVDGNTLQSRTDIPLINPDKSDIELNLWGNELGQGAKQGNHCRVKYHPSYSQNRWMVVEGKLENGTSYPVVLDTGASPSLFVSDIHILENKLPIYPLNSSGEPIGWGTSYLPRLQIGNVTLLKWPCLYREQHTEIQFFGWPLAKDDAIIVGLPLLRESKYVTFDSIKKEAEFSFDKNFEPVEPGLWTQYQFVIEEDLNGSKFLFVNISIAGVETRLLLDTGSGRGLAIRTALWSEIRDRIPDVKLTTDKELYPYIGLLDCQQGIVTALQIGNRTVHNAQISVFPDNSPLVEDCQGLIGMQYFQDTVIVLDFERNLMWVQDPQDNKKTLAFGNTEKPALSF